MTRPKRTVEIYRDRRGKYRYRVKAGNGEIISQSQAYTRRWTATRGAQRNEPDATIVIA
jgi:uncharacterized protein YegP (UPF0339 family)